MNTSNIRKAGITALLFSSFTLNAQKIEAIPFGNMDHWITRQVKESFVIGGHTQKLYEIGDARDSVAPNKPYVNRHSPWATSSVLATVSGITKGSVTVFPENRGNGKAARLETRVEKVKVLGVLNINVLASGTIFLGHMIEPIKDTKNPQAKLVTGIPFSKKPDFLEFDYKVTTGGASRKINGLSASGSATGTTDKAEVFILLQHRWEDAQGNVHAKRIGTGWERIFQSTSSWKNNHRIPVFYGNMTNQRGYASYMGLKNGAHAYYTRNSKGKMVPIHEDGWGDANDKVTHLIVQFSSSNGGAYIGNPNSKLWIDNVGLGYN
ncbi:PCMD domain-containing protein [Elizabethkingia sp. JS20170427COW]|uniref:PCMD domain-containing protein n=1 Tax=Elizabethkingia sp. JS20170427COW TaxID=2583851 RepID=UPI001110D654|nr:PCMD domain-containing protein [Elizabethkingia sp. JS20170427COW]QCX54319.1 glycoside hydrolase xylanase [Elizabethkingia sp. JS20170427COW]